MLPENIYGTGVTHHNHHLRSIFLQVRQGILKGKVSLYHWPPVGPIWNQLYDYWYFLFLFAKQTNSNLSKRRSMVQWYFPFSIPWFKPHVLLFWFASAPPTRWSTTSGSAGRGPGSGPNFPGRFSNFSVSVSKLPNWSEWNHCGHLAVKPSWFFSRKKWKNKNTKFSFWIVSCKKKRSTSVCPIFFEMLWHRSLRFKFKNTF